jgi:hypothetical protein
MGQLSTLLVFLTLAAPAPAKAAKATEATKAAKASIGIQAIEAKPGKNKTGKGVDAKLAKKLRTTLKLMGVTKPDLNSLGESTKKLKVDESTSMTVKPYVVEVTCKKIEKAGVTVNVDLYKQVVNKKTKKKEKKRMVPCTAVKLSDAKPYHVMAVMQSSKKKTLFVISK